MSNPNLCQMGQNDAQSDTLQQCITSGGGKSNKRNGGGGGI